jgi:PEP-CTERM motif
MRKLLWITFAFLFLTTFASTAHADTIIFVDNIISEIDGVTIAGITYNVRFGAAVADNTFVGDQTDANLAVNAIDADLNTIPFLQRLNGLAAGISDQSSDNNFAVNIGGGSAINGAIDSSIFDYFNFGIISIPRIDTSYTQFSVVQAPEPSTSGLTLSGLSLIGLMAVLRKCRAQKPARSTECAAHWPMPLK